MSHHDFGTGFSNIQALLKQKVLLAALSFFLSVSAVELAHAELEEQRGECVVLLHGMGRSALAMKPLQWHLEEQGYSVINESWPLLPHGPVLLVAWRRCQRLVTAAIRFEYGEGSVG